MSRVLLLVSLLSLLLATPVRSAIQFDGVDDQFLGLPFSTYFTASELTVLVWFKAEGPSPTGSSSCHDTEGQTIVGNHAASTTRLFLVRRSATILCTVHNDAAVDEINKTDYVDGTLSHVAVTHTGGTLFLYVQGVLYSSIASGDTTDLTQSLMIGNAFSGRPGPFQGVIDSVATYNVALSAGEIAAIAGARRTRTYKTMPTAYWTFANCADGTSGDGVVFHDLSGNGRPLTGDNGGLNAGFTCRGSQALSRHGGIQ
jgi:Concanavalin A-like lectin/glucanases superfamily